MEREYIRDRTLEGHESRRAARRGLHRRSRRWFRALPFKDLHPRVATSTHTARLSVRVGARVTARSTGGEPREVGLPCDAVAVAQLGVRQVVVPEREAGAAVRILQRHCDARAAGWHRAAAARLGLFVLDVLRGLLVGETPGEDDQVRRLDLEE